MIPRFDHSRWRDEQRRVLVLRRCPVPAVVLGSTQPEGLVDGPRARSAGVAVWRRRAGGGAVFVEPGNLVWADAWLPVGDELSDPEVARASRWAGEWWRDALGGLGRALAGGTRPGARFDVHEGPLDGGLSGGALCFDGVGPGEVTVAGRKVVGVAQWRSRAGTLFHTSAYLHWSPTMLLGLCRPALTPPGTGAGPTERELADRVRGIGETLGVAETVAVRDGERTGPSAGPAPLDVAAVESALVASLPGARPVVGGPVGRGPLTGESEGPGGWSVEISSGLPPLERW